MQQCLNGIKLNGQYNKSNIAFLSITIYTNTSIFHFIQSSMVFYWLLRFLSVMNLMISTVSSVFNGNVWDWVCFVSSKQHDGIHQWSAWTNVPCQVHDSSCLEIWRNGKRNRRDTFKSWQNLIKYPSLIYIHLIVYLPIDSFTLSGTSAELCENGIKGL